MITVSFYEYICIYPISMCVFLSVNLFLCSSLVSLSLCQLSFYVCHYFFSLLSLIYLKVEKLFRACVCVCVDKVQLTDIDRLLETPQSLAVLRVGKHTRDRGKKIVIIIWQIK